MATLCVLIKALNEERRIEACLRAAVDEALPLGGEVILVDSLSTDRTVELARAFPVRIVQFESRSDCGCAAAVQLGYQFADAEFVYVLDADMVLQPGFLAEALARLRADASLAGVGGRLLESKVRTGSDVRRAAAALQQTSDMLVPELGGGGLYRVAAIRETGYLAHRGLSAFEEAELGARLRSSGWKLMRLLQVAVLHEGHAESNWRMLMRLWRNGRAQANGAVIRAAIGRPWCWQLMRKQAFLVVIPTCWLLTLLLWLTFGATSASLVWSVLFVNLTLLVALALKKRSIGGAWWAFVFWHSFSLAAVVGLFNRIGSPLTPVAGRELTCPRLQLNFSESPLDALPIGIGKSSGDDDATTAR